MIDAAHAQGNPAVIVLGTIVGTAFICFVLVALVGLVAALLGKGTISAARRLAPTARQDALPEDWWEQFERQFRDYARHR